MDAKGFSPHPKKGLRTGALLGFLDETGFSDRPTVKSPDIITYLKNLKRHIKGRRLILFWDGLCAHRSKSTSEYVKSRKSRLTTERTPAYAPEVNPAGRI